ncbi:hypothetical protein VTJ83DRAFT_2199 [Remersonia thermophila]|uniref:MARVEL domain-containing protein n=1 Tax=Remersonia thermophila TaxID=72144 RepID=A0ABR4DIN7_9PEZI
MSEVEIDSRSNVRLPGREHIPIFPKGWVTIRIVQGVLALIIMALSGHSLEILHANWLNSPSTNFILAVAVLTLLSTIWHMVYAFGPPKAFNYWAVIALDVFFTVFWAAGFPYQVAGSVPWVQATANSYYYKTDHEVFAILLTIGAIGGAEFILYVICLIVGGIRTHRHRKAGLRNRPVRTKVGTPGVPTVAMTAVPQAQPAAAYPVQQPQPQPQPQLQPQPVQPQPQAYPPQNQAPAFNAPQGGYYTPVSPATPQPPQPAVAQPPPQGFYSPSPPPQQGIVQPQPIVPQGPHAELAGAYTQQQQQQQPPPQQQQRW